MGRTGCIDESGGDEDISTSPQNSTNCEPPSGDLKASWPAPRNVRELAAQANQVATMFLNGTVNIEVARTYATIARVVAQAASIEVARSRFLKEAPDLTLETTEEEQ